MIYRLIFLNGPRRGQQVTVPREPLTIGRGAQCGLQVDDPEMAHVHACVEHRATGLLIRDLGTMNKILVNHVEIKEGRLRHGDVVEIGRTRFLVQALVQAEVQNPPASIATRRRRRRLATLTFLGAAAAILLAVSPSWRFRATESATGSGGGPREVFEPLPEASEEFSPGLVEVSRASRETVSASLQPGSMDAVVSGSSGSVEAPEEPPIPPTMAKSREERETQPPPVTPAPPDEPLRRKADEMLVRARGLVAAHAWNEAEDLLVSLERIMPEYLPAYLEHARLLTHLGRVEPALRQCDEVLSRAPDTPWATEARTLRDRLLQAQNRVTPEFGGKIRIASSEQTRFPATSELGEVRSVSVVLRASPSAGPIEASAVRVDLRFFERDPTTGQIRPSPVTLPGGGVTLAEPWPRGDEKIVTATYRRPLQRERGGGASPQFYGYVVRVYYFGALQDEWAQPARLLQQGHDPAAALGPPAEEGWDRRRLGSAES